jgi:hypothetical protein
METPIPQPYDITEIPHIAWVPGAEAWGILITALTLVILLVWLAKRRPLKRSDQMIVNELLGELRATLESSDRLSAERTSRIARRIMSHLVGGNLSELSSDELRTCQLAANNSNVGEAINTLADLEAIAYAPASPQRDAAARELGALVTTLLENISASKGGL